MNEPESKKEPFVSVLSPHVKVLYGFKDAHAVVGLKVAVDLPSQQVAPAKIPLLKRVFDVLHAWALKSKDERKEGKGDIEEVLDDRCKVRGGFPDAHVDLCVRVTKYVPLTKIEVPWIPIVLSREEVIRGKKTMDDVYGWHQLPEEVRNLQGI